MNVQVRDATNDDFEAILLLNQEALPWVSPLDQAGLVRLSQKASYFKVATQPDRLAGFLIAVAHDSGYESRYFEWFCDRYQKFIYIDRVIVAEWARGWRIAWRLYEDIEQFAASISHPLASDVYSKPPNEISLRFHKKYGFELIGTQLIEGTGKEAAKFLKVTGS